MVIDQALLQEGEQHVTTAEENAADLQEVERHCHRRRPRDPGGRGGRMRRLRGQHQPREDDGSRATAQPPSRQQDVGGAAAQQEPDLADARQVQTADQHAKKRQVRAARCHPRQLPDGNRQDRQHDRLHAEEQILRYG